MADAATKIQAGFRGHKTRQDMKEKKEKVCLLNLALQTWWRSSDVDL